MPSIDLDFLSNLHDDFKNYSNFVETGTYLGDTTFCVEPHFDNIYTIEIKKQFYEDAKNKYSGNKIKFFNGDSSQVLKEILPTLQGKSIIFLDGHWSANNTGRGEKDCPLYEEVSNIIKLHEDEAIIIIDDVRLFGKGPNQMGENYDTCNWEDINKGDILNIVQDRFTNIYFRDSLITTRKHGEVLNSMDRLIIHLKRKDLY
tara:strand:- start:251 stop:856 length:606 start_codon:yes stop_codon:yes gene_type:complete